MREGKNRCSLEEMGRVAHVDDVGQVVDVVLEDGGVGGLQGQQVLVPGLQGLQLVL